jgi:hypothetical protein
MNSTQKAAYNKHLNRQLAEINRRKGAELFSEMFAEKVPDGPVVKPVYREMLGKIKEARIMRKIALGRGFALNEWLRDVTFSPDQKAHGN